MNTTDNALSFTLQDGSEVEFAFAAGTYEIFGEMMGLQTMEEVIALLKDFGGTTNGATSLATLKTFRRFIMAAAQFAALSKGRPFTANEWQVQAWIDQIGYESLLSMFQAFNAEAEPVKKVPMSQRIKATQ